MKHKLSITLVLLSIFLLTQIVGLFVIDAYSPSINPETNQPFENQTTLPYGLEAQESEEPSLISIVFSFALAFALIFFLMKYRWKTVIRIWFLLVTILALAISLNALLPTTDYRLPTTAIALLIATPLAIIKIFKPTMYLHNATEILVYPGIAAVFVPILSPVSIMILLILISIYDAWAVWKSGVMQKMAEFQMTELKIFGGFMIPSTSKSTKEKIRKIKTKYRGKNIPKSVKNKKFKVNLAILGGGDVIFPIITSGIFLRYYGLTPAILIILGSLAGLISIFLSSEKDKAYPAMPYITAGIFAGLLIWKILF